MDKFISAVSTKNAYTDNGAITNSTTLNKCLDFFSIAGGHQDMLDSFLAAFGENPQLAIRVLFWSRDCRGGAGAKKNFQICLSWLQKNRSDIFSKIFSHVPEYGYWKDLYKCIPTKELVSFIAETLKNDQDHSLCAKFCPRKGIWFSKLRNYLKMSPADFRHFIVNKTQVVEQYMCAQKWSEIDYSSVPSVAARVYSSAFVKHDMNRYYAYLESVNKGEAKINASVLFPSDIYADYCARRLEKDAIRALWNNMPNFMEGCKERIMPICDVSGSMIWGHNVKVRPIDVSIALGVYIAEHNEGPFHNCFMTFSRTPEIVTLTGDDIFAKFEQVNRYHQGLNTDLQAVFDLILRRAKEYNLSQEDLPTKFLILSDMEIDSVMADADSTNFEAIDRKFKEAGYERPGLIFWNIEGRSDNMPVTLNDKNCALVSGYSPAIVQSVLGGDDLSPMAVMLKTVNSERYSRIIL